MPKTTSRKSSRSCLVSRRWSPKHICATIAIIPVQNGTSSRGIWSPIRRNDHISVAFANEVSKPWLRCRITLIPTRERNRTLVNTARLLSRLQVLPNYYKVLLNIIYCNLVYKVKFRNSIVLIYHLFWYSVHVKSKFMKIVVQLLKVWWLHFFCSLILSWMFIYNLLEYVLNV